MPYPALPSVTQRSMYPVDSKNADAIGYGSRALNSVATTAEHVKTIFHDSDRHTKAKNNDAGWMMGQVLGQCVGLLSGDEWTSLRRHLSQPFSRKSVREFFPIMHSHTQRYLHDLRKSKTGNVKELREGRGEQKEREETITIHPAQDLKLLPFSLVAVLLYGKVLDDEDLSQQLYAMVPLRERLFMHVIGGGITRYWWSSLFTWTEANRLLRRFQQDWLEFNQRCYEKAKQLGLCVPIVGLWEGVVSGEIDRTQVVTSVNLPLKKANLLMPPLQLLQSLDEVLFANLDVTTGALSWLIVNMASSPSAQARLLAEIRSKVGCIDRPPDDDALTTLWEYIDSSGTFLASCVVESARVRPVAAFSIPQAPPTDRVVGGYRIPARTSVVVDAYALNIRDPFWGEDGARFRPERWEGMSNKTGQATRYQMWRFGFGPRVCMGQHIAEKMMRVALVLLVGEYEFKLSESPSRRKGDKGEGGDMETSPESWITTPNVLVECQSRE